MADRDRAHDADIVIIGGGMVGISLALLLAAKQRGWRISLIESHPLFAPSAAEAVCYQSRFDSRSTALAAGSASILETCGVWPALVEHLTPIRTVHVSDRGHFGGSLLSASDLGLPALGYVVENPWLGRVLAAALRASENVHTIAPAQVKSCAPDGDSWLLALHNAERVRCQLLVLADGADSTLRAALGIDQQVADYGQQAIIANVRCDRPHGGVAYERFTDEGPIALLPLGSSVDDAISALVWTRPESLTAPTMARGDGDFLRALQNAFGHRGGRFIEISRRFAYPLRLVQAREQVRRGLVLMGNAAHFLHPVAGQGFNLALRDCQALADTLADGGGDPGDLRVLQAYAQRQTLDQRTTVAFSDGLVRVFSNRFWPLSITRQLGLLALNTVPRAQALLARQAMGYAMTSASPFVSN